jgi:hypothetical protein
MVKKSHKIRTPRSVPSLAVDSCGIVRRRKGRIGGHVIAHEVAHVLIGPGHSEEGIMRGVWSPYDLQRISWGPARGFH